MLVFERKIGEKIRISDEIQIQVIEVRRRRGQPRVRLGIIAPPDIPVHREEVYQKIQEGNTNGQA